jgi:putative SOS response-associated peptidase YedK
MPVILDPADYPAWLGEAPANENELRELLRPFPAEKMRAFRIGQRIGNVGNDDAALIEPIPA